MFDVFFISYDEENADENWRKLNLLWPLAYRIHGVKGILNAHKIAATKSGTSMIWVVDGDSEVLDTFDFSFIPPSHQRDHVHVWRAKNPINNLVYGYGGIKLLPVKTILNMPEMASDMTTHLSDKFKVMNDVGSITAFNSSPFAAWRAGFREAAKLSSKAIPGRSSNTDDWLEIWCSVGRSKKYGEYTIAGAVAGRKFGFNNPDISKINDYTWLNMQFDAR